MRLELNTNGAWRTVLSGLSRHDKAAEDRYLDALTAARMLAEVSAHGQTGRRRGIEWRLVSEADNRVTHRCTGDGGWVEAYWPGDEA